MKIKLIEVGRNKATYEAEVKNEKAMLTEVKKHLLSRDVSMESANGGLWYVYAGIRPVGKVLVIKP